MRYNYNRIVTRENVKKSGSAGSSMKKNKCVIGLVRASLNRIPLLKRRTCILELLSFL